MDNGGNDEVSNLKKKRRVFTTNQTVASERIQTVTIEQLRFLSYNCRTKSFFVIELGYFNVSILTCCSFKNFKRGTVSKYRLDCSCDLILFLTPAQKKIKLVIN